MYSMHCDKHYKHQVKVYVCVGCSEEEEESFFIFIYSAMFFSSSSKQQDTKIQRGLRKWLVEYFSEDGGGDGELNVAQVLTKILAAPNKLLVG